MSLTYRILWFEDNREVLDDNLDEINEYFEELGFNLELNHQEDGQNLELVLENDYDLILSDMNLGEGETGKKIIDQIRSRNIYTEVLFYSGNEAGINKILEEEKWIERISFCVGMEYLLGKILQVISLTLKKLQEVNSVRGMVMSETSELDVLMIENLIEFFNRFDTEASSSNKKTLIEKTISNREGRVGKLKALSVEEVELESLFQTLEVEDRIGALNRLIKFSHATYKTDVFSSNKEVLSDYNVEISKVRNVLAHAKVVNEAGVKKVVSKLNGQSVSFDDKSLAEIRKNIKKHRGNLENIKEKISKL